MTHEGEDSYQVIREYKGNNVRSRTFLIRYTDGTLAIKKTFHPEYQQYLQREVHALRRLKELDVYDVIPSLLSVGVDCFVVAYFRHVKRRKKWLYRAGFRLLPLPVVRRAFLALKHFYEQGFELLDMGPKNVLFNSQGEVKVIDFEFAFDGAARQGVPFERSQTIRGPLPDWVGDVPAGEAGRRDGGFYRRRWSLCTSLPIQSILYDSPRRQAVKRVLCFPYFYIVFLMQSVVAAKTRRARRVERAERAEARASPTEEHT